MRSACPQSSCAPHACSPRLLQRLACHRGRAHKLALEPDSACCFLSCGEGDPAVVLRCPAWPALAAAALLAGSSARPSQQAVLPTCRFSLTDGEVRHFDLREPGGGSRRLLACRTTRGRLELNSVHCRPGACAGTGAPAPPARLLRCRAQAVPSEAVPRQPLNLLFVLLLLRPLQGAPSSVWPAAIRLCVSTTCAARPHLEGPWQSR